MANQSNVIAGPVGRTRRPRSAFTLIELLVVVAIIALLISILLPSLSKARAQARATVCASRISQLCKALLLYAEDHEETPPFMGRGWEDHDNVIGGGTWPDDNPISIELWARWEDWIMPDMPDYWGLAQEDWPDPHASVRNGSLYRYTRFDDMYRCPDFQRITGKSQDTFNYCRSIAGRKYYLWDEAEGQPGSPWYSGSDFGACGPIVKISAVYAPSAAWILGEEKWDTHIAAGPAGFSPPTSVFVPGGWMASDCMFYPLGSLVGQYHGSEVDTGCPEYPDGTPVPKIKRGTAAYYDGHAALVIDPMPTRNEQPPDFFGFTDPESQLWHVLNWFLGMIYSVRGKNPPLEGFIPT